MASLRQERIQGWAVWALALLLVVGLPGSVWKPGPAPAFPWPALIPVLLVLFLLVLGSWTGASLLGPRAGSAKAMALLEAPPDLLWGALVLALWPAAAGPPGMGAWTSAFLAATLPGEIRWLGQALPKEHPFPSAWGASVIQKARWQALSTLAPRWFGARFPLWLTGGLVLERILGVQGLGSDWSLRVTVRDRAGMGIWILVLALLWRLASMPRKKPE